MSWEEVLKNYPQKGAPQLKQAFIEGYRLEANESSQDIDRLLNSMTTDDWWMLARPLGYSSVQEAQSDINIVVNELKQNQIQKAEPVTIAALAALAGYTGGAVAGWISGTAHMEQKILEEVKAAVQEVVEQNKPPEIIEEPVE